MTDGPQSTQPRVRVERDTIDVSILILAFASGITALIILKAALFPVWLPATATAAIIIAYAFITYFTRSARLDPDQIGDNAYYLGFVFTLTSLGHTLYKLGEDATSNITEVISGFGIALSSTIVGVIVRVVLLQYRVDLTAREGEVRLQLNEAARLFHTELADVVRSTKFLGVEIRQHLEEHHKEVSNAYEKRTIALVGELIGTFKNAFEEIVEQGKETNRRLAASARSTIGEVEKAAAQSLMAVSENIKKTSEGLGQALKALASDCRKSIENSSVKHAESMRQQEEMMRSNTEAIARSSDSLRVTMEKLAADSQIIAETSSRTLTENTERYEKALRGTSETLQTMVKSFVDTLKANLEEISEQMAAYADHERQTKQPTRSRWALFWADR